MTGRIVQLDVLRAVAILLVMGRHWTPAPEGVLAVGSQTWLRGGWIGVDLFFVLSGFLIAALLFREHQQKGSVCVRRFLIRRAFKIYPAFWAMFAASLAIRWNDVSWPHIVGDLLFLQNYFPKVTVATWSLAVEEHFYLLFAGLVWLFARRSSTLDWVPLVTLAIAVSCLSLRLQIAESPFHYATHFVPTHLRIDGLMFGVLLSYGWHCRGLRDAARPWSQWLCLAGALALIPPFLLPVDSWWITTWGFMVNYLGAGALLIGLLGIELRRTAVVRALATLGAYSYSIFLWHIWAERTAQPLLAWSWALYAAIYFAGAVFYGVVAAKAIEYPLLRIRDQYFPSLAYGRRDVVDADSGVLVAPVLARAEP